MPDHPGQAAWDMRYGSVRLVCGGSSGSPSRRGAPPISRGAHRHEGDDAARGEERLSRYLGIMFLAAKQTSDAAAHPRWVSRPSTRAREGAHAHLGGEGAKKRHSGWCLKASEDGRPSGHTEHVYTQLCQQGTRPHPTIHNNCTYTKQKIMQFYTIQNRGVEAQVAAN